MATPLFLNAQWEPHHGKQISNFGKLATKRFKFLSKKKRIHQNALIGFIHPIFSSTILL